MILCLVILGAELSMPPLYWIALAVAMLYRAGCAVFRGFQD